MTSNQSLPERTLREVLEPVDLSAQIIKILDINNDKVKDYIVAAKDSTHPTWQHYLMIIDGKTGRIIDNQKTLDFNVEAPDIKVHMVGNTPQITYIKAKGKTYIYTYQNEKLKNNDKAIFIKNNKLVIDESNISMLLELTIVEAKEIFGGITTYSRHVLFEGYNVAMSYDGREIMTTELPSSAMIYEGTEFMGLILLKQ